jgi:hypothetical protein
MGEKARVRVRVLAGATAVASLASGGLAVAARAGFELCDRHLTAAQIVQQDGMAGLAGLATASAGSGDVCPLVVNLALGFGLIAASLAAWLLLTGAAPLAKAVAAALRTVIAPGPAIPWLVPVAPAVVPTGIRVARRGPSRAPPTRA